MASTAPSSANPLARTSESEKLTINLGFVDLGQIDLLVTGSPRFQCNK